MKRTLLALLCVLVLAGCAGQPSNTPESGVPGFYAQGQEVSGGQQAAGETQLEDITVKRKQEELEISLQFTGGGQEGGALPAYTVEALSAPARLVLRLPSVRYTSAGQDLPGEGQFAGLIYEAAQGDAPLTLYFQFTGQIAYKVAEDGDKLLLTVRADDPKSGENFFVRVPYAQDAAAVAEQFGLLPVLCHDGVNVSYLSAPFGGIAEADAQCEQVDQALSAAGADSTAEVIQVEEGQLPEFREPVSRKMILMMGALKTGEKVRDARIFAMDARFLCWMPGRDQAVIARPQTVDGEDGSQHSFEEIWVYQVGGERRKLFDSEFNAVQKAAVSPDGRYLALIEQSDGMRLLYLYDQEKGALEFLATEGMGDYTADFAWSEDGKLYAMSGDDVMQLMVYDPALSGSEERAVQGVEEREGSYGNVGVAAGKVYFSDESGDIYRVDPASGGRELFAQGDGFRISPDGSQMALVSYEENEEDAMMSSLSVVSIKDGASRQVSSQDTLGDFCWSRDGGALFYLLSNPDDANYPVRLMRYDLAAGQSQEMGLLASNAIFPGLNTKEIMLMSYHTRNGVYLPVTYRLSLEE